MSLNLNQIPTQATSILATDKMYIARSPFGVTDDRYILGSDIIAQLASPLTTKGDLYTFSTQDARLAVGTTNGQILQVNAAAAVGLSWSTASYPTTTTINQLLYSSAADTVSGLPTANDSVLITSALGVPSFSSTLPNAVQDNITRLGTISSGLWNGTKITVPYGGTDATSFTAYMPVCGGTTATGSLQSVSTVGAVAGYALTYVSNAALPTWQAVGAPYTPAALTEVNDTNVTMTLGGTPNTALLQAVSMTLGWTGQLSLARGGTNANLTASTGGIVYSGASAMAILAGTATANQIVMSGASAAPSWSTATYLPTMTANAIFYASALNTMGEIAPAASSVLITSAGSVPSLSQTLPAAVQGNITTVGTIVSGTWHGSVIELAYGGTNANLTASNGGIVWSNATQMQILSGTATARQMLQSGSTATPAWSTTTWPATSTAGRLLYSSFNNVIDELTTTASAVLTSNASSVPTWTAGGSAGDVLTFNGTIWTSAAPADANVTITNDTTTNATMYPTWVTANSGTLPLKVTSTKLSFNPSTGTLNLVGPLQSVTQINDANGNVQLGWAAVASAVNYVQITNATAAAPTVGAAAVGTSATVNFALASKNGSLLFQDTTVAALTKWYNAGNTHYVGFQAGALSADSTYTWPTADGSSGYVLQTNGAGVLSFVPVPSTTLPTGTMFNFQSASYTGGANFTNTATWSDLTGVAVTITPTSSSNKVNVHATINYYQNSNNDYFMFRLVRGSTPIGVGNAAGSRTQATGYSYINIASASGAVVTTLMFEDSPATTSSTTYKVQYYTQLGSTLYLNSTASDTNAAGTPRTISTIEAYEVKV